MISGRGICASALALVLIMGCGPGEESDVSKERLESMAGGKLKDVVPVSGKVLVDGQPTAGINLYLHDSEGGKPITDCRNKPDGTYCWSTHALCDGIEAGSYRLSFRHVPKPSRNDKESPVDLFNGRYSDPKKVEYSLTVQKDTPQTDVNYELTSK